MCTNMCMYVCIYIYIFMCMYVCIYIDIYIYIYVHILEPSRAPSALDPNTNQDWQGSAKVCRSSQTRTYMYPARDCQKNKCATCILQSKDVSLFFQSKTYRIGKKHKLFLFS